MILIGYSAIKTILIPEIITYLNIIETSSSRRSIRRSMEGLDIHIIGQKNIVICRRSLGDKKGTIQCLYLSIYIYFQDCVP